MVIKSARWVFYVRCSLFFNGTAVQARTPASKRLNQSKSWSTSEPQSHAKERVKRTKENPKDYPKKPRVRTKDLKAPKAHAKIKHLK